MGRLSPKLRSTVTNLGKGVSFWCPGCEEMHAITIDGPHAWGFDGNPVAPTFAPSILVRGVQQLSEDEHRRVMAGETIMPRPRVCHSFVRAGRIEFLGDCTHALRSQVVALPDLPPHLVNP